MDRLENSMPHKREEPVPKKLRKTVNRKQTWHSCSLGFLDVNNLPRCVLCNKIFSDSIMAHDTTWWFYVVKLLHHFGTNNSVFGKKKRNWIFKCRHNELFESQKLCFTVFQTTNGKARSIWQEKWSQCKAGGCPSWWGQRNEARAAGVAGSLLGEKPGEEESLRCCFLVRSVVGLMTRLFNFV